MDAVIESTSFSVYIFSRTYTSVTVGLPSVTCNAVLSKAIASY